MTIAVNDLFKVDMIGECFSQRIMLSHYYAVLQTDPNVSEETGTTALLTAVSSTGGNADEWETAYRQCLPPDYNLLRIRAQKIAPVRFRFAFLTANRPGSHLSTTETANQSAALTFRTRLAGRAQVATKHIGPIPGAGTVQVNGFVADAYKTILSNLGNKMSQILAQVAPVIQFIPVIAHRNPLGSYTLIVDASPGDTLRVQRRRTVGLGE